MIVALFVSTVWLQRVGEAKCLVLCLTLVYFWFHLLLKYCLLPAVLGESSTDWSPVLYLPTPTLTCGFQIRTFLAVEKIC